MTNTCTVIACGRPSGDGYVCRRCITILQEILAEVPWMVDELNTVITRQSRYTAQSGSRSTERVLPVNLKAAEVLNHLAALLASWTSMLVTERKGVLISLSPHSTSAWLQSNLEMIRCHSAGPDLIEEISGARAAGMYAIDRPAERKYAGPCACGADLYAKPNVAEVTCDKCERIYSVAEMVEWMRAQVVDKIVTEREAYVLLGRFGIGVASGTIRKWHERKRVLPVVELDPASPNRFRMSDLIELAADAHARRAGAALA